MILRGGTQKQCWLLANGSEPMSVDNQTSDFRLQTSDFRLQTSDFRLQTSDFRLQTSDFRLQTSDFRLQTSDFRLQTLVPSFANMAHCFCVLPLRITLFLLYSLVYIVSYLFKCICRLRNIKL